MQPGVVDPPSQSWKPLWIRETLMSETVGPVTSGGKIRFKTDGFVNDIPSSSSENKQPVPSRAP